MDKIYLTGMQFWGRHGVLDCERELGQRYIVDLELELDLGPAAKSGNLNLTVNYAEVYEVVRKIVCEASHLLIETVAETIAHKILKDFKADCVTVTVKKPQAPIPGIFEHMAVKIIRCIK